MVLVSAESERHPHTKHPPCIRTEISIDGVNIRLQGEYYCCSNNLSYGIMVHDVSIKRGLIHSLNGQPSRPFYTRSRSKAAIYCVPAGPVLVSFRPSSSPYIPRRSVIAAGF